VGIEALLKSQEGGVSVDLAKPTLELNSWKYWLNRSVFPGVMPGPP
jgi:hypothetical protein